MNNKKLKEIGTRIRESRKAKKLSQNELSEIVQVSPIDDALSYYGGLKYA